VKQGGKRGKYCVGFLVKMLIFRIMFMNENLYVLETPYLTITYKDDGFMSQMRCSYTLFKKLLKKCS